MMSLWTGRSLVPPLLLRRPAQSIPPPWSLKTESCGNCSRLISPSPCGGGPN